MQYILFKRLVRKYADNNKLPYPSQKGFNNLFKDYEKSLFTAPVPDDEDTLIQYLNSCTTDCLAPLPKAVPAISKSEWAYQSGCVSKEEGKTPMRYNDNYASANAYVATPQSDTSTQRDFLLKELANADYPKTKELTSLFNLYVDNTPKTYKEMIDIIKAGTYTIDPKIAKKIENAQEENDDFHCGAGPMYGIVWPGPVTDFDGYKTAVSEQAVQYKNAKRIIVTGDATAGLKALQDFEAWLPTPAAKAS